MFLGGSELKSAHSKDYSVSISLMSNGAYMVQLTYENTRRATGEANCKTYLYYNKAQAIAKYEALARLAQ